MKRALLLLLLAATAPLHAQSAGKTGAQVLQLNPGGRAGGLAGAYTATGADADALFYNPAGIANSSYGASVAFENAALDVGFGSIAGFTRIGRFAVGASVAYLDAGSIVEVEPDPEFGGNVGTPTGNGWRAYETAARISVATRLSDRLRVGASAGFVSTGIAEANQNAPIADLGAHYDFGRLQFGASLRNLGGTLSGGDGEPLPTEVRLGAAAPVAHITRKFLLTAIVDGVARVREGSFGGIAAMEAGMPRGSTDAIGGALRVGYDLEAQHLGAFRFGATVSLWSVSVDYAYQNLDMLGAVHRFGVRWTVLPVQL